MAKAKQALAAKRDLFAEIASIERTTRLYQVLGDRSLLDAFHENDRRLTATRTLLEKQLRSTPARVNMATSVAASSGESWWTRPPTPAYSPSEFSRTITQSSSGPVT